MGKIQTINTHLTVENRYVPSFRGPGMQCEKSHNWWLACVCSNQNNLVSDWSSTLVLKQIQLIRNQHHKGHNFLINSNIWLQDNLCPSENDYNVSNDHALIMENQTITTDALQTQPTFILKCVKNTRISDTNVKYLKEKEGLLIFLIPVSNWFVKYDFWCGESVTKWTYSDLKWIYIH